MSLLSEKSKRVLEVSLANKAAKVEVLAALGARAISKAIVATNVSTSVDFASLEVGDIVLSFPAVAGDSLFEVVVAAGLKPSAAVVGDLYLVLKAV